MFLPHVPPANDGPALSLEETSIRHYARELARAKIAAVWDHALLHATFWQERGAPRRAESYLVRAERKSARIRRELNRTIQERERRAKKDWLDEQKRKSA